MTSATTRRPSDALFALLRLPEGNFKFHTGTHVVNVVAPQEVAPVLEEAENRLALWPSIAGVVPSLHCEVKLQESVEGTVMLRPDQWQLVASIGGGRQVTDVLDLRSLGEFEGCKAVKELVDLHLVKVTEGEPPQLPEASLTPAATRAAYSPPDLSELNVAALGSPEWHEEEREVAGEADVTAGREVPAGAHMLARGPDAPWGSDAPWRQMPPAALPARARCPRAPRWPPGPRWPICPRSGTTRPGNPRLVRSRSLSRQSPLRSP